MQYKFRQGGKYIKKRNSDREVDSITQGMGNCSVSGAGMERIASSAQESPNLRKLKEGIAKLHPKKLIRF